jgi:peroxiredoxin
MLKYFILLVLITPLVSTSQTTIKKRKEGELVIHGTLNNLKESVSSVYMICLDGNTNGIDSVRVINNKYIFRIQTEVTTLVTIYAKDPGNPDNLIDKYMLVFLAEPTTVMVYSIDSFSNAKITGSKAYLEHKKLEALKEPFYKEFSKLYENYLNKEKDADIAGMEQLQKRIDSILDHSTLINYKYIKANPSSFLIPHLLNLVTKKLKSNAADEDVDSAELVYNKLSENDKNSYYGKRIRKKLDSFKINIGMSAPSFVQNDTSGNPISLASFKGKYVLLDFWASWCIPCRAENPTVVKAFNAYKDKGFTVLSISLEKPDAKDKWMEAIHKDGLTWTNLSDLQFWNNTVAKLYKVNSIPQNFLIDPSGKIIGKDLRGTELEKILNEILN